MHPCAADDADSLVVQTEAPPTLGATPERKSPWLGILFLSLFTTTNTLTTLSANLENRGTKT